MKTRKQKQEDLEALRDLAVFREPGVKHLDGHESLEGALTAL